MKIAHLVTLIDPKGSFGGPVRVALNQAKALIELGHEVTIYASCSGFAEIPMEIEGVPVKLFPVRKLIPRRGFAGLFSPGLRRAVNRDAKLYQAWHVHLARDFVMLPAASVLFRKKARYVVQSHGMIIESKRIVIHLVDRLATLRILRSAAAIFALTESEEFSLQALAGKAYPVTRLINGVPQTHLRGRTTGPIEFLFLGRLQARKRPLVFARAALSIAANYPAAIFTLAGPDEGELASLKALLATCPEISNVRIEPAVAPGEVLERIAQASVFVLPSVNEPFPMAVLEAMSLGLPVVITESCGLAEYVRDNGAGLVIGESEHQLIQALQFLAKNQRLADEFGANASEVSFKFFSMQAISNTLNKVYGSSGT